MKFKRFLFFVTLLSVVSVKAQDYVAGDAYVSQEREASMIPIIITPEAAQMQLPSAVDNSTRSFMPPIFNHGKEYAMQSDRSLHKLNMSFPLKEDSNLQEEYWSDLVTEQPEGYVVDANGDVEIYTSEGLAWLISTTRGLNGQEPDNYNGRTIKLKNDIDMSAALWQTLCPEESFQGFFDGEGHEINGLFVSSQGGLFFALKNARIENVKLGRFVTNEATTTLAYTMENSQINRCSVEREDINVENNLSGLVYYVDQNSLISNSMMVTNKIFSANYGYATGFAYINEGSIKNCAYIVIDTAYRLFPMMMYCNNGVVENCYNYEIHTEDWPMHNGLTWREGVAHENLEYGQINNCYYNNNFTGLSGQYSSYTYEIPYSSNSGEEASWTGPFDRTDVNASWSLAETQEHYETYGMQYVVDTLYWETGWGDADITLIDALNSWVEEMDENEGDYVDWVLSDDFTFQLPILNLVKSTGSQEGEDENNDTLSNLSLWPNPTDGTLTVTSDKMNRIIVCNILGQSLIEYSVESASYVKIDLNSFGKGIYIINVELNDGSHIVSKAVCK